MRTMNIENELKRTGLSYNKLSSILKDHYAWNLSVSKLKQKISENDEQLLEGISEILNALPDKPRTTNTNIPRRNRINDNYIEITENMRLELVKKIENSKINISLFCAKKPKNLDALTPVNIAGWKSGRVKSAHKASFQLLSKHLDFLISKQ